MRSTHVPSLLLLGALAARCASPTTDADPSGADGGDGPVDARPDEGSGGNPDAGSGDDAAATPVDAADDGSEPEIPATPADYVRSYPDARAFAAPAGHRWARSIVHLHSIHSHDACDETPRLEGNTYNLPCLASLRTALCDVRIDVAWLTDHPTHMVEVPWLDAMLHDPAAGDELVSDSSGQPIGNVIHCPDGHSVLIRPGSEDALMPLGLTRHIADDVGERDRLLNLRDAEATAAMRQAGALVWQAHTEGRSLDELRAVELDGVEIYQLHANIAPNIRSEDLGLDPIGPIAELMPVLLGDSELPPDLAFLVFVDDNRPSLNRWAALLADHPTVGTAGTDAHENTFPNVAADGERVDSYRRMMAWFANYVLVEGELTAGTAQAALAAGRVVIVFDILGAFDGFDAAIRDSDGARFEVGATLGFAPGLALEFAVPALHGPSRRAAEVAATVLRAEGEGWVPAAGPFGPGAHSYAVSAPGIYRVEVRVSGEHLAPFYAEYTSLAERDFAWIVTNAWRVL